MTGPSDVGILRRTDRTCIPHAIGQAPMQFDPHYRHNKVVFSSPNDQMCGCLKDWLRLQMHSRGMEDGSIEVVDLTADDRVD